MPNRTISLSIMEDEIRKELVKKGFTFSNWVGVQLIMWKTNQQMQPVEVKEEKIVVPYHYQCRLCRQHGHHHTQCSLYQGEDIDATN